MLASTINSCNDSYKVLVQMLPVCNRIGGKAGEDGISVAKTTLVQQLDKAMKHPNKFGYLVTYMKGAVSRYRSSLSIVRIPQSSYKGEDLEIVEYHQEAVSPDRPDHMLQNELRDCLSHRDFQIIMYRLDGLVDREIGKRLGVSREAIVKRRKKIKAIVKELIC